MPTLPPDMPDEKINDLVDYMMTLKGKAPAAEAVRRCHGQSLPDARPATARAKPMRMPNRMRRATLPRKWRAPS